MEGKVRNVGFVFRTTTVLDMGVYRSDGEGRREKGEGEG